MPQHMPFNNFDMAGITDAVNRYKDAGLRADYDISRKAAGVVFIRFLNPVLMDGSTVIYEIHKIAHKGWLVAKAHWVIQLYSELTLEPDPIKKGCVSARYLPFAISAAEHDLRDGFISVCDFELAAAQD